MSRASRRRNAAKRRKDLESQVSGGNIWRGDTDTPSPPVPPVPPRPFYALPEIPVDVPTPRVKAPLSRNAELDKDRKEFERWREENAKRNPEILERDYEGNPMESARAEYKADIKAGNEAHGSLHPVVQVALVVAALVVIGAGGLGIYAFVKVQEALSVGGGITPEPKPAIASELEFESDTQRLLCSAILSEMAKSLETGKGRYVKLDTHHARMIEIVAERVDRSAKGFKEHLFSAFKAMNRDGNEKEFTPAERKQAIGIWKSLAGELL